MVHSDRQIPPTLIVTPLGDLEFLVRVEDVPPVEVSLRAAPLRPTIPLGMSVLGCYGVVLQITASTPVYGLNFKASLKMMPSVSSGPATGEGLEAQEWISDDYVMLVGTEDADYLRARLPGAIVLPDNPFTYSHDSLSIRVSAIPPAASLSLHFVVAWNRLPELVEPSCWFAVDQLHSRVLGSVQA